jgi:hypothetical protein
MSGYQNYFHPAMVSQAAYASFASGISIYYFSYELVHMKNWLPDNQLVELSSKWRVIDQYDSDAQVPASVCGSIIYLSDDTEIPVILGEGFMRSRNR